MIHIAAEDGADGARTLTLWDGDHAAGILRARLREGMLWVDKPDTSDPAAADALIRAALHGGRLAGATTAVVAGERVEIEAFLAGDCHREESIT